MRQALWISGLLGLASWAFGAGSACATVINIQSDLAGSGKGSVFCGAGSATTLSIDKGGYTVTLSGGIDLGPGISNLPANASVLYGTADTYGNGCPGQSGYTNPLTIRFFEQGTANAKNVTNFFVDLYNGNTVSVDYTLSDNLGNSATFAVGNNFSGGQKTFGFAAAGSELTIEGGPAPGGCCGWDFFINNIGFNEAIPGGHTVPEPGTWALALVAGWAARSVRRVPASRTGAMLAA